MTYVVSLVLVLIAFGGMGGGLVLLIATAGPAPRLIEALLLFLIGTVAFGAAAICMAIEDAVKALRPR